MAEKPEDLSLPASVIARIIKDALPEGVSVSKEARVAISKAASVFILYCTACSNNLALQAKRKTLAASDVISAMSDMEFDEFVPELKTFLEAYRKDQKGKRVAAADKRKQKAVAAAAAAQQSAVDSASSTDQTTPPVPQAAAGVGGGGEGERGGGGGEGERGEEGGEQEEAMETDELPAPPSSVVVSSNATSAITT